MASHFPSTYYSCPCVSTSTPHPILARKASGREEPPSDDEEPTFDPKSPRANLGLIPLEYLLWCSECHQIRCARCTVEEVVCWYCPTCLFEVPSSTVRSEGNRCTRNCYNCPICTAPLTVHALETPIGDAAETPTGPFILMCGWCNWSSLDIGVKLDKSNNLTAQLNKLKDVQRQSISSTSSPTEVVSPQEKDEEPVDPATTGNPPKDTENVSNEELFSRPTTFYKHQISESLESPLFGSYSTDASFASPSAISRILNIYSSKKSKRLRPKPMREALSQSEGLHVLSEEQELALLERQSREGWSGTTSTVQRAFHPSNNTSFVADLWPVPSLLRTKRSKRCKSCRALVTKPEARMASSRWRHRVLALQHIPKITLRAFAAPPQTGPDLGIPAVPGSFDYEALQSGRTYQYLLTAANPLFDPVNVTLATAATTPGHVASRVTILCPEFVVGANTDVWDEALGGSGKRKSVMPGALDDEGGANRQAKAGKVWSKGRNWTSVIVEIVPGFLPEEELDEDDDVLEIAVFVRMEYETDAAGEEKAVGKERREEAYWTVLGAGRIKPLT